MENNELIKIEINEKQEPIVSGRDLHEALEVKTPYKDWFPKMCAYGFVENQDYCSILSERIEWRLAMNHAIKLDMAKEIAMIQRNEVGKRIRQYFVEVEKDFNSPEKIMARSLIYANSQINQLLVGIKELNNKIKEQKLKVIFADSVRASTTSILVGELAKLIKQNGHEIGQNRLFQWLRDNNYLISRNGTDYNMPTQKSMELGLFEIKESSITYSNGHIKIKKTPKVTGKGQVYFINKFTSLKGME